MPYYRSVGELPRKRHLQFRDGSGALFTEELMSSNGFSEESSLLYHRFAPMAITAAEEVATEPDNVTANQPLMPRHFRLHNCKGGGDAVRHRQLLLKNGDVAISYVVADETSPLYRDAVGDEVVYVEAGRMRVETVFGALNVHAGDYLVIPTNTTHRFVVDPTGTEAARLLVLESSGHVNVPQRYMSTRGQLKEGAPYSERDLAAPGKPLVVEAGDDGGAEVLVRTLSGLTRYMYAHHPFDVVGWDGCLYPWRLSIHDFEPIVGRVHQPPPVHQTFAGPNFVVCSFVPRPFDFDPDAVPIPYAHANVDSDEVIFYTGGDFMSRAGSGIEAGSVSLHPSGFVHGPQPGSVERAIGQPRTEELAVMVDTFRPLGLAPAARAVEDEAYPWTWSRRP